MPLSHLSCLTGPLIDINLRSALIKELVSNELAVSKCMARHDMHVKSIPYLLSSLLPSLIIHGPNKSTPLYVKGGSADSLSGGRSLIFWPEHLLRNLRHVTHLEIRLNTAELHPIIQNPFDLISLVVRDRP